MKSVPRRQQGKDALELIEEAVHLLRTAPAGALAAYYLGGLPFVLGLLYFWADMSRNPFAYEHAAEASLGLAMLFLWMKFWQVIFARKLRAAVALVPPEPWNFTRCRRVWLAQSALQPWGLFLLPLSLLPVLPVAWVYAFFQNLTALDDGESPRLRELIRKSARQAALWPRQNHVVLLILLLFGGCVFLNWTIFGLVLPNLTKTLLGVESVFTRSGFGLLNTTFFAAMFGLAYLCVDPIAKTVYVLRCFYGESLASGEDLKVELKHATAAGRRVTAALAMLLLITPNLTTCTFGASPVPLSSRFATAASPAEAGQSKPPSRPTSDVHPRSPSALSSSALDDAIAEVIQQRKYTWRVPRDTIAKPEANPGGLLRRFLDRIKKPVRAVVEWVDRVLRKLFTSNRTVTVGGASALGWVLLLKLLLYALVVAAVVALGWLLFRWLQNRRRPSMAVVGEAVRPAPDLTDENLGADQLPEDGWTKLARELFERGELRLALRAFYLASLAHLAERNLISLARFKSNRDYELELRRRGHSFAGLLAVFGENVSVFDRIWYGMHDVTGELVRQFAANVERIKAGG